MKRYEIIKVTKTCVGESRQVGYKSNRIDHIKKELEHVRQLNAPFLSITFEVWDNKTNDILDI